MSRRTRIVAALAALLSLLTACTLPFEEDDSPQPTATPSRPAERESVYISGVGEDLLTVRLNSLSLNRLPENPDIQILAVLADGNGQPAYIFYPSNQPGVPDDAYNFAASPLQINSQGTRAGLWVLAVQNAAGLMDSPLVWRQIASELATAFDVLQAQAIPPDNPLAGVVAEGSTDLRRWFGAVEVIGETSLLLQARYNWFEGENRLHSGDDGFTLSYDVMVGESSSLLETPAPIPDTPVPTPEPTAPPGYKLVLNETFLGENDLRWFTGQDDTYSADVVDGAYQIRLTGIDENEIQAVSWGSLQDLLFDDYIVRAQVRVAEENVLARYGLWLHYQDNFHYLFFGMENTGRYRIARFDDFYTEITGWQEIDGINRGNVPNILEVHVLGDRFTLYINDREMTTVTDSTYPEGRIAFFCYAEDLPATCQLEWIQVWIPENAEFPRFVTP